MKQMLQNLKTGETQVVDVPVPQISRGSALVKTSASLVSAGTERMLVKFARQSLVGKAKSRPDLARQVISKAQREGLIPTFEAAMNKLDQPMVLGYSSAGTIVKVGPGLEDFKVGDRVACGGGGHAVHAEFTSVPQNLLARIPDSVDFESAAFTTIGAIAMQGFRLAEVGVGARVAVIGLGLLGLLTTGIANAAGCQVLAVDLDPSPPDSVTATNTASEMSVSSTSLTGVGNLNQSQVLANTKLQIETEAGAAPGVGVGFTRTSLDTPQGDIGYIALIATNDFFVSIFYIYKFRFEFLWICNTCH